MLAYEEAACRRFDAVVAVSPDDRDFIRDRYSVEQVYDVPTGVDTEYFRPQPSNTNPTELVFTGSMDWMPNEDAVLYFAREILARIHDAIPAATFTIAGRNPGAAVRALEEKDRRVRVTGDVPDIRPYIREAAVYVAPLRCGGGTRLKIFEAMSMAKPVVSTSIGAEGLPLRAGEELVIADSPAQFASAAIRLLRDRDSARRIGARARVGVCERFSWENASASFATICERVLAAGPRVRAA
jgi:glycosyltransferase involved in cell wall biosynthesis